MQHVKITIAYDGSHYKGFQYQPGLRTVQGELEDKLKKLLKEDVKILGSSRTDAGVHAHGQVVKASYMNPLPPENLKYALNKRLPSDLVVKAVEVVDYAFHPIADTQSKIYEYQIRLSKERCPFQANYTWHVHSDLDLDVMKQASRCLIGKHDFASFCASGSTVKSTIRQIYSIEFAIETHSSADRYEQLLKITFHGSGFLYNMVRILTATLVHIGQGNLPPEELEKILLSKKRANAPWTAPPNGLYLKEIFY